MDLTRVKADGGTAKENLFVHSTFFKLTRVPHLPLNVRSGLKAGRLRRMTKEPLA